jgi:hypothetical protein
MNLVIAQIYIYLTAAENARLSKLICISNACDLSRQSARTGEKNQNSIEKKRTFYYLIYIVERFKKTFLKSSKCF